MYLAFLNLPREVRQGRENVLLVGVIPDMKSEPKNKQTKSVNNRKTVKTVMTLTWYRHF
jgi:hypothetical protein